MVTLLKNLKATYRVDVRYAHCNNADENESSRQLYNKKEMDENFEYIVPSILQHNGRVERKFATLFN